MASFKIGIQTMGNKRHTLEVKESDSVLDVKRKIETDLQIGPVDEQKLIYMGKILKDEQTLEAAKIKANDMLVVMIAKKKTAPATSSSSSAAPAPAATATTPAATPAPAAAATPSTAPPSTPAPATTNTAPVATPAATPAPVTTPTTTTTTPPANVAVAASSALLTGSAREEMVQNLMGLGFPRDQVEVALRAAFNNPDRAADYLFNGIPDSAYSAAGIRPGGGAATNAAPTAGTAAPTATTGAPSTTGTAPSAGLGAGGLGALAGLGGAGGGAGGNEGESIRQLLSSNPQLIPMLLQQLAQTNPELVQQIQQNPAAFLQMLGASGALSGLAGAGAAGGAGGAGRGGGRSHVIQITPEEKQSIDNLQAMGFDRNRALEAFLLCDRNEELAANYLFENAAQFAEEDREAAAHGHGGGRLGGGGDGGGDDDGEEGDGEDFGDMPE